MPRQGLELPEVCFQGIQLAPLSQNEGAAAQAPRDSSSFSNVAITPAMVQEHASPSEAIVVRNQVALAPIPDNHDSMVMRYMHH